MQENSLYLKQVITIIVAVLITLGLGLLIVRALGPLPVSVSQTTTQKESSFSVTGESEIVTSPDQAEVSAGIVVNRPTIAAAQDEANRVASTLTQSLQEIGIKKEDIKTTNYNVQPEYDYQNPGQRILGYSVNTNMQIKTKNLDLVNQIIDTATAAGANQVHGVQFTLSEEKEKELTKQAREEAINDAQANAKELAQLAGMKLGRIVNIMENTGGQPPIYFAEKSMAVDGLGGGGEPTQIEPGSTNFSYSVTLSYETL